MELKKPLTKLYYGISEVAELFKVNASLIRYWDKEFSKLSPIKNNRGERRFTAKDIAVLQEIYTLVKERGFTIEGAKNEMKAAAKISNKTRGVDTPSEVPPDQRIEILLEKLEGVRSELKNIIDKL